jgi:hypothetical protein
VKRLSLSAYDAEHVYEWLRMYWRGDDQKFGGCYECERTGRRLERFIGPAAVRRVSRVVQRENDVLLPDPRLSEQSELRKRKHAKEKKG